MEQYSLALIPERRIYSVSELNAGIRAVFETEFADIWVAGEISGAKMATSGHCYFTLKERDSQISCVCFRSAYRYLKFKPLDGIAVLARGRMDVFEARGSYQLLVEMLEPQGYGALQLAFEQLKKKLAAEGLFEAQRKRPLPKFPRRIGIITSPKGAVISDMLQILSRRFPGLHVRIFPAQVQGEGSVNDVCKGLDYFSRSEWAELVIVARGGGSLEDLWTFNEEAVARAIVGCRIPVVSAIGHETDVTIADFVADLRAPTPSAAAELIICTRQELLERIAGCERKLSQALRYRIAMAMRRMEHQGMERARGLLNRQIGRQLQRIDDHEFRLRESVRSAIQNAQRVRRDSEERLRYFDPRPRLQRDRNRLMGALAGTTQAIRLQLQQRHRRLESLAGKLSQLSPLSILERGYAIVMNPAGQIVKRAGEALEGNEIRIRLASGQLDARVTRSQSD